MDSITEYPIINFNDIRKGDTIACSFERFGVTRTRQGVAYSMDYQGDTWASPEGDFVAVRDDAARLIGAFEGDVVTHRLVSRPLPKSGTVIKVTAGYEDYIGRAFIMDSFRELHGTIGSGGGYVNVYMGGGQSPEVTAWEVIFDPEVDGL